MTESNGAFEDAIQASHDYQAGNITKQEFRIKLKLLKKKMKEVEKVFAALRKIVGEDNEND